MKRRREEKERGRKILRKCRKSYRLTYKECPLTLGRGRGTERERRLTGKEDHALTAKCLLSTVRHLTLCLYQ